jgi:exonuclease SbcD
MKIVHLSDLHLGKKVNEVSMIEDQQYILTKIINIIDDVKPQAVIIAGDVYDKSVPIVEAVGLFDSFLVSLAKRDLSVFVISGNHDSNHRMAFASRLMDKNKVYFSPVYDGKVKTVELKDNYGSVNIHMLPFLKPANVRAFYPDEEISTYTDALKVAVDNIKINTDERNVLITHQFVTGASKCESEEISVGGTDNVDVNVFDDFDYVALGHIHNPQNIGRATVRYCGTPLKYSFSECNREKSVTVVELKEKGQTEVTTVPLIPKRDMKEIKGTFEELTLKSFYENSDYPDSYLHVTLTDEDDITDAIGKLRLIYPHIMKLDYDNVRTRTRLSVDTDYKAEEKSPLDMFEQLYQKQNNQPMSQEQSDFVSGLIEKIWRDK